MNKKTRLYYNGVRQKDVYLNKTKFQLFKLKVKKFLKGLMWFSFIGAIAWVLILTGSYINPRTIVTNAEVIKEVEVKAPILDRIAKCESGGNQFDKNGQVLMRSNTNKTVDVGKYQINSVWFAKATELGYDLTTEKGNEGMANWIYKNKGTGDWMSSFSCWHKQ